MFSGISLVSLTIALSFFLLGFWLVLPFAGLELAALAAALWHCARRTYAREVISIRGDQIAVERGQRAPEEKTCLPRDRARVELEPPVHRGHPTRLLIRSQGRQVEVGGFLNEDERCRLAADLRRWVNPVFGPYSAA